MRKPQKKREHENKTQKDEKKEKVAVGLAVACETLKPKGLAYYSVFLSPFERISEQIGA